MREFGVEPLQFNWFQAAVRLYNALAQSTAIGNSSTSLTAFFFSGEGAFLPKWPLFLNRCEELFAACVVSFFFFHCEKDLTS